MTSDIYFDNFIITSDKEVADRWASDSWGLKKLVASANEVSFNRYFHCHLVHMIYHCSVFSEEKPHICLLFVLGLWSCVFFSPAGYFRSAAAGSGGTTMALADLHTDSWPACRTDCALLLPKGTLQPLSLLYFTTL